MRYWWMGLIGLLSSVALAREVGMPAELRRFVLPGHQPLAVQQADLDGDGRSDYLLALDKPDDGEAPRPLLVIRRGESGGLEQVARSDKALLCASCGGVFGDPFESLSARRKSFSVSHYGGSNWRWAYDWTFNYSRIDRAWQLVRVEESSFHTSAPERMQTKVYVPPRDYGKIDLRDFDPDSYRKR